MNCQNYVPQCKTIISMLPMKIATNKMKFKIKMESSIILITRTREVTIIISRKLFQNMDLIP